MILTTHSAKPGTAQVGDALPHNRLPPIRGIVSGQPLKPSQTPMSMPPKPGFFSLVSTSQSGPCALLAFTGSDAELPGPTASDQAPLFIFAPSAGSNALETEVLGRFSVQQGLKHALRELVQQPSRTNQTNTRPLRLSQQALDLRLHPLSPDTPRAGMSSTYRGRTSRRTI